MGQDFSFSYQLETAGWSTALVSDGEHTGTLTASYLSDALGDLTRALIALLRGAEQVTLTWQEEPGVVEWRFERQGDHVNVYVTLFDDWSRYRSFHGDPAAAGCVHPAPGIGARVTVADEGDDGRRGRGKGFVGRRPTCWDRYADARLQGPPAFHTRLL